MTAKDTDAYKFDTRIVHAGFDPDPATGAVIPPISLSSTFAFQNGSERGAHMYSRISNPNRDAFEKGVASAENAKYALAFSSGMGASTAVLHLLSAGDSLVRIDDLYAATQVYIKSTLAQLGVGSTPFSGVHDLAEKIQRKKSRMVWLESPTNPTLKVTDIAKAADIAHKHGCIFVFDNTFMSPYCQQPLSLGADIVIHSVSKYINGHTDVVMGVLCTNDEKLYIRLQHLQINMGAVPSPFDCYLASRGLRTLALRMSRHVSNALQVAKFLEHHPAVRKTIYPGLPSHKGYEVALKQSSSQGGMITFYINGGMEGARKFLKECKLLTAAVSLGAVESLVEHPASMTHSVLEKSVREELGISDELIRMSVGIEHPDDIIADLQRALDASLLIRSESV